MIPPFKLSIIGGRALRSQQHSFGTVCPTTSRQPIRCRLCGSNWHCSSSHSHRHYHLTFLNCNTHSGLAVALLLRPLLKIIDWLNSAQEKSRAMYSTWYHKCVPTTNVYNYDKYRYELTVDLQPSLFTYLPTQFTAISNAVRRSLLSLKRTTNHEQDALNVRTRRRHNKQ